MGSNERMEFLGDAIVGFLVGKIVYSLFPAEEEGVLSRLKAYWVSTGVMAGIAGKAGIKGALELGAGEAKSRGMDNPRNLAGALEAVVAALYLDGGMKRAESFVTKFWKKEIQLNGNGVLLHDFKTRLQELLQKSYKDAPQYEAYKESGSFAARVVFRGDVIGTGLGASKKKAEQEAAKAALRDISVKDKKER